MPHLTQRQLISTAAGLAAGLAMLGFALVIHLATKLPAKKSAFTPSFAYSALLVFMGAGILLTPTIFLSGGLRAYDCSGDTIASYQAAGEHLRRLIPPGSRVYWKGGLSVVPLLYVPGIQIYAPQINGDYSYYLGGDPETLLRFGFWNDELNRKWLEEADYALVQERYYKEWAHSAPPGVVYDELEPSPPSAACLPGSRIHVFKRIKD